jgi:hypothetical protein
MPRRSTTITPAVLFTILVVNGLAVAATQGPPASLLDETGKVSVDGREVSYRIRNLPINSFPELPAAIADALTTRGCLIPQTYQAHRPENVIHGSLERSGSADWAVLCSAKGQITLLVFFASGAPSSPTVLAESAATDRLQPHDSTGVLGFNWGIDPASPRRIHDAQAAMAHRPPQPDHDCLADSTLDGRTVYHLYRNGAWEKVALE